MREDLLGRRGPLPAFSQTRSYSGAQNQPENLQPVFILRRLRRDARLPRIPADARRPA